jgi:hypothetical protein
MPYFLLEMLYFLLGHAERQLLATLWYQRATRSKMRDLFCPIEFQSYPEVLARVKLSKGARA